MVAIPNRRSLQLFFATLSLLGLLFVGNLGITFLVHDPDQKVMISDLSAAIASSLSAGILLYADNFLHNRASRLYSALRIIALGQLSYAIGDITWAILELVLHQAPFPSLADGFYLLYYPLFLIGIILLPARKYSWIDRIKMVLDISIVMLAALLGFWTFLIGPLVSAGAGQPFISQALSLAYPVGDLMLLTALLVILFHPRLGRHQNPILLLSFGIIFMVISDCVFSFQSLSGGYASGGLLDLGWLIGNIFVGLAGLWLVFRGQSLHGLGYLPPASLEDHKNTQISYLPYLALIFAFLLLIWSHSHPIPLDFNKLAIGVGGVIGLVLFRQILNMVENERLYARLRTAMSQVGQQSAELIQANHELQMEITERQRIEERLAYDALHDALTGLPNRALLMEHLHHAIQYNKRHPEISFSVLFLDLDDFKVINDSLGHITGDQLLVACTKRIGASLRSSDTLARLGGDEFVILLVDSKDEQDAINASDRILLEFDKPFNLAGYDVSVRVSIGIVNYKDEYNRPEDVLQDADIAMYRAKANGKSRFEIFQPNFRDLAIARLDLQNDLRKALDSNQFCLHYQPILSLKSNEIVGFEALVRWLHPVRGMLYPADFIPAAEEAGLIVPLGKWILYEGCRQIRDLLIKFPKKAPFSININVSSIQLMHPDFVQDVENVLQELGLPGSALKLEITESVCLNNTEKVKNIFLQLGKLGIQFLIDDFGIGYSSLNYLHQFPIQTIKIDRAFTDQIGKNNDNGEIVHSILELAKDLGLQTVAEGIETKTQLDTLKKLGCGFGQGFLLSYPTGVEMIESLLEEPKRFLLPKTTLAPGLPA